MRTADSVNRVGQVAPDLVHSPFETGAMPAISTFRVDSSMKNSTMNRGKSAPRPRLDGEEAGGINQIPVLIEAR